MRLKERMALLALALGLFCSGQAQAEKIGALVTILGAHSTSVEGIGIVTGLNRTGDKKRGAQKALRAYLDKNQLAVDLEDLESQAIALVRVDAEIPAFKRPGQKISVRVTVLGDAISLEGGVLANTPLFAKPDGEVYAWASGRIIVGGGTADSVHPTSGRIPANAEGGAKIVKTMTADIVGPDHRLYLELNRPSYADAAAIARRVNNEASLNPTTNIQRGWDTGSSGEKIAWAVPGQVEVLIPESKRREQVEFISAVLDLEVAVERPARVLVNRQTNTLVMTGEVRFDPVTISHRNLTVTLSPAPDAAAGDNLMQYTDDPDNPKRMIEIEGPGEMPNLQKLNNTLNAMGCTTRDVIVIVEKLKNAGALHAELIVE